jgi:hypothetical protein
MQSSSDIYVLQKLATSYKVTLMNFLVDIHINNPSTLYKVNLIAGGTNTAELRWIYDWAGEGNISRQLSPQCPMSNKLIPLGQTPLLWMNFLKRLNDDYICKLGVLST